MAPFAAARDLLDTIPGVAKLAAEPGHLASWAEVCPGNNVTGGKRHSGRTNKGDRWLGETLNQCAWAASHTRDTYLSAQFWRLAGRIGKKKAAVAVGHSILVIAWHDGQRLRL